MNDHVPFLDLVAPHQELESELIGVVREALRTGRFIGGPMVEEFENDFAGFCGTRHAVGVGSGTDALRFALIAAGVRPKDIVVTVPFTFIATAEAITQAGATPAFVDIDPETCTMDPAALRRFLETRCRKDPNTGRSADRATGNPVTAVVPVHLYGQTADMNAISAVAEEHRLLVVEDACQAHGASWYDLRTGKWKKAGSLGAAAAFSFYPGKNLGACGEAGAVTTNDDTIALKVRTLRDHGQIEKYIHAIEGYNGRLDAIQAGILKIKLLRLSEWNDSRRRLALRYTELLSGIEGVVLLHERPWARSVYHVYAIRVADRTGLQSFLADNNITTGLHYPVPLHLQQAYAASGYRPGQFPASEKAAREVLSLPMFPGLHDDQQVKITRSIREFVTAASAG